MARSAPLARSRRQRIGMVAALAGLVAATSLALTSRAATAADAADAFYSYSGAAPLGSYAPGAVLATRSVPVHVASIPTPLTAVQILYRSTGQLGQPTANVTSVLLPPWHFGSAKLVSYDSFYDSLNPADSPSRVIASGSLSSLTLGSALTQAETAVLIPALLAGYTVVETDTEGQNADFADGPEYGMNTLDGIRAAEHVATTGVGPSTPIGLIGYSGGAIGEEWASELATKYAPELVSHIVGTAIGGVLVDPAHNLSYVSGSLVWSGVMAMAIVGIAQSFHIDLTQYLSAKGLRAYNQVENKGILQVAGEYPGLTWAQLAKPEYANPARIPAYVTAVNQLIMGANGTPTEPMLIGQGANGILEGTSGSTPGIGAGDGVMIAGDVRTLARTYCGRGLKVEYQQYDLLSHTLSGLPWAAAAVSWLLDRFAGKPAPQNCASIAPGNPLLPVQPAS